MVMLTPCHAETAFQCQKLRSGIFPFLGSRTDATVAELPRSWYLGIDLACRHAQQPLVSLSSLLPSSQCHPASRGQQPLPQTNPLLGKKASDAALVPVSLAMQGCMEAVGVAVRAAGAGEHLYEHSGGMP